MKEPPNHERYRICIEYVIHVWSCTNIRNSIFHVFSEKTGCIFNESMPNKVISLRMLCKLMLFTTFMSLCAVPD